ncbi:MAG: FlgD immunoglobulin-like domain containing protein [bacterium]
MRNRRSPAVCLLLLGGSLSVCPPSARAQWLRDGVALCTAPQDQSVIQCVTDGAHGAFVYFASPSGPDAEPLAQRVDGDGVIPEGWPACGIALSATFGSSLVGCAVADGAGGAILAWTDRRAFNKTYVQRVTSSGVIAAGWPADPAPVVASSGSQSNGHLATDGASGAIVAWETGQDDVYAVRLTSAGSIAPGWPSNGRRVSLPGSGMSVSLCEDGSGGAFVAWSDRRDASTSGADMYCQRLASDGSIASGWPVGGIPLCVAPGWQGWGGFPNPITVSDGLGGALVLWPDPRDRTSGYDLYLDRVDPAGGTAPGWTTNGVPVCVSPGLPQSLGDGAALCPDGTGGAFVAWSDGRLGATHVYAQHVGSDGDIRPGWPDNGLLVCGQRSLIPALVSDGTGGAIVAWLDDRGEPGFSLQIYATRLAAEGLDPGWPTDGLAICTAGSSDAPSIAADGTGGAIIAWSNRPAGDFNVYAQHVTGSGVVVDASVSRSAPVAALDVRAPAPNPTTAGATIRFSLPRAEVVSVEVLTVSGRRVRQLARAMPLGTGVHALTWDGRDERGNRVGAGVYFVHWTDGRAAETRKVVLRR